MPELRDPAAIAIADVLALYAEHVAPNSARPKETLQMIERLAGFFGDKTLADINGELCRGFVRKTKSGARRDLSVLRAAINFHREKGLCDRIVSVTLPEKEQARDRWLARSEAAALIWRDPHIRKALCHDSRGRALGPSALRWTFWPRTADD